MAKKTQFNFGASVAAQDINEQMEQTQHNTISDAVSASKRDTDRQLVQARVPTLLQRRMAAYCAQHDIKKMDFIAQAIQFYLEHLKEI